MVEPITILSALATIIGVTISTSIQLTNLFSSIHDAPKEILGLYLELKSVQSVILDIQKSFEHGDVYKSLSSEWVEDLDLTLRSCMEVLTELLSLINKLKSNKETGWYKRAWKGLKWTFLEREIRVLTTRLESSKATLGLKLQALSIIIGARVEGRVDKIHGGVGEIRDILERLVSEHIVESSERAFLERNIGGLPSIQTSPGEAPGYQLTPSASNSPPSYWSSLFSIWNSGGGKGVVNDNPSSTPQYQQDYPTETYRTLCPVISPDQSTGRQDTHTITHSWSVEEPSPVSRFKNFDHDYFVSVGIRFGSNSCNAVYLIGSKGSEMDITPERTDLSQRLASKIPTVLYYSNNGQVVGWVHDTVNSLDSNGSPRSGTQRISRLYSNSTSWKPWSTPATLPYGEYQTDVAVEYLRKLQEAIYLDLCREFGQAFRPRIFYHLVSPLTFNDAQRDNIQAALAQSQLLEDRENSLLRIVIEPEAAIINFLQSKSVSPGTSHVILTIGCSKERVDLVAFHVTEGSIVQCTYRSGDTSGSKAPHNRFAALAQNKVSAMRTHEQLAGKIWEKCVLFFENEICEGFNNCGREWRIDLSSEGHFFRAGVIDQDGFMTFTNTEILRCFNPLYEQIIDLSRAQITAICQQGLQIDGVLLMGDSARPGYLLRTVQAKLQDEHPDSFVVPINSCAAIADGAARAGLMSEIRG